MSKDSIGGVILLVFFVGYALLGLDIHLLPAQQGAVFSARTMPQVLAVLGIAGSVWLIATSLNGARPNSGSLLHWWRFAGFLALMSVFGITLRPLGFLAATSIFLICGFLLLGERRVLWLAGVTGFVAIGFWVLLSLGLGVYIAPWPNAAMTAGV